MIKNEIAQYAIDDCRTKLDKIWHMIEAVGSTNKISGYLTRYALVRICGTLEISYKTIIADYYVQQSPLLDRFIIIKKEKIFDGNITEALKREDEFIKDFLTNKKAT